MRSKVFAEGHGTSLQMHAVPITCIGMQSKVFAPRMEPHCSCMQCKLLCTVSEEGHCEQSPARHSSPLYIHSGLQKY